MISVILNLADFAALVPRQNGESENEYAMRVYEFHRGCMAAQQAAAEQAADRAQDGGSK